VCIRGFPAAFSPRNPKNYPLFQKTIRCAKRAIGDGMTRMLKKPLSEWSGVCSASQDETSDQAAGGKSIQLENPYRKGMTNEDIETIL
jgi:hypothetical protein